MPPWDVSRTELVRLLTCMTIIAMEAPYIQVSIKTGFLWCPCVSYRNSVILQACKCKVLAAVIETKMPVACDFLISKCVFLIRFFLMEIDM